MNLKSVARNEKNDFLLTFEEFDREEKNKTTTVLQVKDLFKTKRIMVSAVMNISELKGYIEKNVRTRTAYIHDKTDRRLFLKVASFMVNLYELPINVKEFTYPGNPLVLLEYGTLGITDTEVEALYKSIVEALEGRTEAIESVEEEIPEPSSIEDELGWKLEEEQPFPLGGIPGDFVEDEQDFDLGKVEEPND